MLSNVIIILDFVLTVQNLSLIDIMIEIDSTNN